MEFCNLQIYFYESLNPSINVVTKLQLSVSLVASIYHPPLSQSVLSVHLFIFSYPCLGLCWWVCVKCSPVITAARSVWLWSVWLLTHLTPSHHPTLTMKDWLPVDACMEREATQPLCFALWLEPSWPSILNIINLYWDETTEEFAPLQPLKLQFWQRRDSRWQARSVPQATINTMHKTTIK